MIVFHGERRNLQRDPQRESMNADEKWQIESEKGRVLTEYKTPNSSLQA